MDIRVKQEILEEINVNNEQNNIENNETEADITISSINGTNCIEKEISMSWSRDTLEKFIRLYQTNPCLWKVKNPIYKNHHFKNRAYEKLIAYCKKAVCDEADKDFVLQIIQNLRKSFFEELKTERREIGFSENDLHKKNLWYFDLLTFLKHQEIPEDTLSNGNVESDNIKWEIKTENVSDTEENEREQITEQRNNSTPKYFETTNNKNFYPPCKRLKRTPIQSNAEISNTCRCAFETSYITPTEYEAVGINVGKKLEKMENSQAIFAESLINVILRKGLLNELMPDTMVCENSEKESISDLSTPSTPSLSPCATEILYSPSAPIQTNSTFLKKMDHL